MFIDFDARSKKLNIHMRIFSNYLEYNNEFPELFFSSADNSVTVVSLISNKGICMVIFDINLSLTSESKLIEFIFISSSSGISFGLYFCRDIHCQPHSRKTPVIYTVFSEECYLDASYIIFQFEYCIRRPLRFVLQHIGDYL